MGCSGELASRMGEEGDTQNRAQFLKSILRDSVPLKEM